MTALEPCGNVFVSPELPCTKEMQKISTGPHIVEVKLIKRFVYANNSLVEIYIYRKTENGKRGVVAKVPFKIDTIATIIQTYLDLLKRLEEEGLLSDVVLI